jgi:hypothetical protein
LLKDAFGDGSAAGKDMVTVSLTGGDKLTLSAKVKGKGVKLVLGATVLREK